jgi:CDP-2,3-bis-(O-geranylgeranyl)-sn-glycerol synthase
MIFTRIYVLRIIQSYHSLWLFNMNLFVFILVVAIETIYLGLPAIIANASPPVAAKKQFLERFNRSIDGGLTFRGKRVFGDHKTIRGFLVGIPLGLLVAYGQSILFIHSDIFRNLSLMNYDNGQWIWIGLALSAGALVGDAVKSFFKRQIGIAPGKDWPFWDQMDLIFGALIFLSFVNPIPIRTIIAVIIIGPILHITMNKIGHHLQINRN